MEPITRPEFYLAALVGEYAGELPDPVTRQDRYLYKLCMQGGGSGGGGVTDGQVSAAIQKYFSEHVDVTLQKSGYAADSYAVGQALDKKVSGKGISFGYNSTKKCLVAILEDG